MLMSNTTIDQRLHQIGVTLPDGVSHSPRFSRVSQLDAQLLDQDLLQILLEPISTASSSATVNTKFEPEIRLLLQLVLYKLSIWNMGASYGAKLQNLGFVAPTTIQSAVFTSSKLPRDVLIRHASMKHILPYFLGRIRDYAVSHSWADAPSFDKRQKFWRLLNIWESAFEALCLVNFISFLLGGRYPTLTDRFLGMRLIPSLKISKREVSYEFMNRQMVWHALTEFLLFLLPLINGRAVRRWTYQGSSVVSEAICHSLPAGFVERFFQFRDSSPRKKGIYINLPQDQCAICFENSAPMIDISQPTYDLAHTPQPSSSKSESLEATTEPPPYPIYNPYVTSCGHIFCYQCIARCMLQATDEGYNASWECLRCGELVKEAHRYQVGSSERELRESDMKTVAISGSVYL